jgi:hypothetical protein
VPITLAARAHTVCKKIEAHVLVWKVLRSVVAAAANETGRKPRAISFKRAKWVLTALTPNLVVGRRSVRRWWMRCGRAPRFGVVEHPFGLGP